MTYAHSHTSVLLHVATLLHVIYAHHTHIHSSLVCNQQNTRVKTRHTPSDLTDMQGLLLSCWRDNLSVMVGTARTPADLEAIVRLGDRLSIEQAQVSVHMRLVSIWCVRTITAGKHIRHQKADSDLSVLFMLNNEEEKSISIPGVGGNITCQQPKAFLHAILLC